MTVTKLNNIAEHDQNHARALDQLRQATEFALITVSDDGGVDLLGTIYNPAVLRIARDQLERQLEAFEELEDDD